MILTYLLTNEQLRLVFYSLTYINHCAVYKAQSRSPRRRKGGKGTGGLKGGAAE